MASTKQKPRRKHRPDNESLKSKAWSIEFKRRKIAESGFTSNGKHKLKNCHENDPSCLSLQSKALSIEFQKDIINPVPFASLDSDTGLSTVSVNSDCFEVCGIKLRGEDFLPEHHGEDYQTYLQHVFTLLEKTILTFAKEQLKRFIAFLASDNPEYLDGHENEDHSNEEAFLKITMNFLRRMKLEPLADHLNSRSGLFKDELKMQLKQKYIHVSEGISKRNPTFLKQIYTELHITKGNFNQEHEVSHIESLSKIPTAPEIPITCEDIFKGLFQSLQRSSQKEIGKDPTIRADMKKKHGPIKSRLKNVQDLPHTPTNQPLRTVVTKGVAGIGKTVLTRNFCLDWAEGQTNKDIQLLFPFTFRELNVLKDREFSLVELLCHCFGRSAKFCHFEGLKVLFIFDGLDEYRVPLDFSQAKIVSDPKESVSVDVLLVNLIRGSLLPSACLWITTRPAAVNQIPLEFISLVTEVQGFVDSQKEQYFRKKFEDEQQATVILSHIKSSRLLYIMCYIPIFCWILFTVLKHVMDTEAKDKLPETLCQMYIHFLVVQAKVKSFKYSESSETDAHWTPETRKMVLSLGKLAFEQLQKGNLIFYGSDMSECGLDAEAASLYSGVFNQVFREEPGPYQHKVYCFVHLSVQEFLAALYVHVTFFNSGVNLLSTKQTSNIYDSDSDSDSDFENKSTSEAAFYQSAVDLALQSPNGHLDLFLRFLLGLSLSVNQRLLQGLLTPAGSTPETHEKTVDYLVKQLDQGLSPEKSLNLLYCLIELNDRSLVEQIQKKMRDGRLFRNMSPSEWSAVVYVLLSPDSDLQLLDLRDYQASDAAFQGLLPVIKASPKVILSGCNISKNSCENLSSVISSSSLLHLDLSNNKLAESSIELLCDGILKSTCKLETLSLSGCNLSEKSCTHLSSVLKSSNLIHLDLSHNKLQKSGVESLCAGLRTTSCKLETLSLAGCSVSKDSCDSLSLVFSSSSLTHLDLSNNELEDSGVELLCSGLKNTACKLETLQLSGCMVSERGGMSLASTLNTDQSCLKELDLSYNHPGASAQLLTAVSDNPLYKLDTLRLDPAQDRWMVPGLRKYSCEFRLDPNTAFECLQIYENRRSVTCVSMQSYPDDQNRFRDQPQVLSSTALSGRCYWEVDWSGKWGVDMAVSYSGIKRRGHFEDCKFGDNDQSWALRIVKGQYSFHHNKRQTTVSYSDSTSGRVGVFLDTDAGSLSFYKVSDEINLDHLHTFMCTFTEPLFPGFGLGPSGSSVSLVNLKVS